MANQAAFQLGWAAADEGRARKQQLADEERKLKVTELLNQRKALANNAASLKGADRDKAVSQLQDLDLAFAKIYHPDHNPGALQKDWHWLQNLIRKPKQNSAVLSTSEPGTGTPEETITLPEQKIDFPSTQPTVTGPASQGPYAEGLTSTDQTVSVNGKDIAVPAPIAVSETVTLPKTPNLPAVKVAAAKLTPQQRKLTKQRDDARKQAEIDVAAAGLTPEQEQEAKTRAARIAIENDVATYKALNPDASDDEVDAFRKLRMYSGLGVKMPTTSKWVYKTGKVNGQPVTVKYDEKDPEGRMTLLDGSPLPPGFALDSGKPLKGLHYDPQTRTVTDRDNPSQIYTENDPNAPPGVQKLFEGVRSADKMKMDVATKIAQERGSSYNDSRRVNVIDQTTGAVIPIKYSDFQKEIDDAAAQNRPVRYTVASEYDKWSPRVNMLEDLRGSSRVVRSAINKLKAEGGFDIEGDVKTAVYNAFYAEHPKTAMGQLIATGALANLTPDQQKYVIATAGMIEQAMGMRSILGTGQGSDQVREAITATIPSLLTPSADFALNQMDYFDGTLERVHQYIPSNIKLTYNLGDAPWTVGDKPSPYAETVPRNSGAARPAGGLQKVISLASAMGRRPGWTKQQVMDDLKSRGINFKDDAPQ